MAESTRRDVNRLYMILMIAGSLLVAVLLFWLATTLSDGAWQTIAEQVAGTVLVAGLLTVAWEARGREALAGEVMEVANLGNDVERAGLHRLGDNYLKVPWEDLFRADKVDVYLALGRTWYSTHSASLESLAKRPGARLRVVLADPTDEAAVECMAARFTRTTDTVRADIRHTTDALTALARRAVDGCHIEVKHRSGEPLHAIYRFDNEAVLTLYSHRRGHGNVPFIWCQKGGTYYDFARQDFDRLLEQGVPVPTPQEVSDDGDERESGAGDAGHRRVAPD